MIFGRLKQLKKENEELKEKIEELKVVRSIESLLKAAMPMEQGARKNFVSQVALFYTTAFKDKLAEMVGDQMKVLSKIGLTNQEENILRSNINCLNLINDWCNELTNEHLGDIQMARNGLEDTFDITSEIKDKYDLL